MNSYNKIFELHRKTKQYCEIDKILTYTFCLYIVKFKSF